MRYFPHPCHCFTLDTPAEEARLVFQSHYGYQPEKLFCELGLLKLGPVYTVKRKDHTAVEEGDSILVDGAQLVVGLLDGLTALLSDDTLITLQGSYLSR